MDRKTVLALNGINRGFYRSAASRFSETRQTAWPGFDRALRRLEQVLPEGGEPPAFLDVGCGNGRFACALRDHWETPFRYLGLDASPELVAEARQRLGDPSCFRFAVHDFVVHTLDAVLHAERFAAILLIGVLHHVPGRETRSRLLRELAQRLAPGGVLALSIWRFARFERFRRRIVPWERFLRQGGTALDLEQLEPGDHLLPFGAGTSALRYCHALDDAEARELLAALPLRRLDSYEADGETGTLNRYLLLQRPLA